MISDSVEQKQTATGNHRLFILRVQSCLKIKGQ
jgi:hypothetical protein